MSTKAISFLVLSMSLHLFACTQPSSNQQKPTATVSVPLLAKEQKMDTAYFWKIMDYGFAKGQFNNEIKRQAILEQLIKLTPTQIQDFEIIFQQMGQKANTWNNLAAVTIMAGGAGDDGFYYFRCWLISLGKYHFEETLKHPDHLAELNVPINKQYGYAEVEFEDLISLSDDAYGIVTKKDASSDSTSPRANAERKHLFYDSGGDMKGKEFTNEDLPKIAPKLCRKFKIK
jgi:hypothetical protein